MDTKVDGWTREESSVDTRTEWKHESLKLRMTVTHSPYSYKDDETEYTEHPDFDQNMLWRARAYHHSSITFGENYRVKCEEHGCENAEEQVLSWAREWMNSFDPDQYDVNFDERV